MGAEVGTKMFKAVRYGAIAIGGYLVLSTAVNIVQESSPNENLSQESVSAMTAPGSATIPVPATASAVSAATPVTTVVQVLAPPTVPAMAEPVGEIDREPSPVEVAELAITVDGPNAASAVWTRVAGAEYDLELIGPDGALAHSFRTAANQWSMEGLVPASAYFVRVRVVDPVTGSSGAWRESLFSTSAAVVDSKAPPAATAAPAAPASDSPPVE